MSATAMLETGGPLKAGRACQVFILCEDFAAYEQAVSVCRSMMEQFAGELEFDFKCWNFAELADAACARSAMKAAGVADIILLAARSTGLPPVLDGWLDAFPEARFGGDGVLVLVGNELDISSAASKTLFKRLKQLAGQAGMEFLPLTPSQTKSATAPFQDEDWWTVAMLQSENLPRPASDHWGLNE
jgi:hypothetical protein